MIYLDNAATTPVTPAVLNAMMPYLKENYGNAGTKYRLGRQAAYAVDQARRQVADLIGAKPGHIIFTSGGTEANSLAILGCKNYLERISKRCIITSPTEHESVLYAVHSLTKHPHEFRTLLLPVYKQGQVSVDALSGLIERHDDIGLVSIMYANNEVGTLNNVQAIGAICKEKNILFHTDCVQAAGSFPLDVERFGCDFMSISSHKIHGAKGVGALYVRDFSVINPIIYGGLRQEFGVRGGTENVAGIVGFGEACRLAFDKLEENSDAVINYKKRFIEVLKDRLADDGLDSGVTVNGVKPRRSGKILSLTIKGVDAETLVLMMDAKGVCISAGAACSSYASEPSHVLTALGLSDDEVRSTIRISFSEFNTSNEVERAAKILANCIRSLRSVM